MKLELNDFEKELKIIDIKQAVFINMIATPLIFVLFGAIFYRLHKEVWLTVFSVPTDWALFLLRLLLAFVIYILGVVMHELIHGATWAMFLKGGFKFIEFGIMRKYGTPYCHSKSPMKVKHYIIGGIMPSIILGFIPLVCGLVIGNFWVMLFGFLFTTASIGDFMVVKLLMGENMNDYAEDHPLEAGCYVYRQKK